MDHTVATSGNQTTVSLKGRLTFDDQGTFRVLMKDLTEKSADNWLVDITALDFIDSAGLGLLLRAKTIGEKAGKGVSMRAPKSGHVADIMTIAQFQKLIPFV